MISTAGRDQDLLDVVRTSGRSMAPLIRDHSIISLLRASPDAVVPGEIIVFRRDGKLFAHRLIAGRGHGDSAELREKGDNCLRATWIPGASLLGKAIELRQGQSARSLDVDPRGRRVRWLTAWSRLEADVMEKYVALKARGGGFSLLKWMLLPPAVVAAPFRFIMLRIFLTVYPRQEAVESAPALRCVIRLFRSLFSTPGQEPDRVEDIGDWNTVLDAAGSHGVLPLVTRAPAGRGAPAAMPPRMVEQIKKQSYRIAFNHTLALQAVREVARALSGVGVPYAVLKGPFLYEALYQGVFPREYEDVDILASRQQVRRALSALESTSYEMIGGRLSRAFLRVGHFHFALRASRPGWPPIELHWSLVDRGNLYRMTDDECLGRLRQFGAGNDAFSVLALEDEFIYLCLHAAKHGAINFIGLRQGRDVEWFCRPSAGNRLIWFADMALFLRKSMAELDWQVLRDRARTWNVVEDVCDCLRVLDLIAPESPAREALNKLQEGERLAAQSDLVQPPIERHPVRSASRLSALDRLLDWAMRMNAAMLIRPIRILLIGRLFFPSPRRLLSYYGIRATWLLPWLYLRHPFHMIRKLLGLSN